MIPGSPASPFLARVSRAFTRSGSFLICSTTGPSLGLAGSASALMSFSPFLSASPFTAFAPPFFQRFACSSGLAFVPLDPVSIRTEKRNTVSDRRNGRGETKKKMGRRAHQGVAGPRAS